MEQGYQRHYHIAVANSVARLGFASKDNVLMKSISSGKGETDVQMEGKSSASLGSGSIIKLCSNTCKVALVYQPIGGCP